MPPADRTGGFIPIQNRAGQERLSFRRAPQLDRQRAVAVHALAGGWRLADDEALNRHRVRRQPDRDQVQADLADDIEARLVEQSWILPTIAAIAIPALSSLSWAARCQCSTVASTRPAEMALSSCW